MQATIRAMTLAATLWGVVLSLPTASDPLLQWGCPEGTVERRGTFCLAIDGRTRAARWTLEYLTPANLTGHANRQGMTFAADVDAPAEFRATDPDYSGSGFDRGHLVPAADMTTTANMRATFNFANCVPEVPEMNRGAMAQLEATIRDTVHTADECWVFTIPLYVEKPGTTTITYAIIGAGRVAVPTHVAKSILTRRGTVLECKSWIVSNEKQAVTVVTTVDAIESAAGLDLFGGLDDVSEKRIEAVK